MKINNKIKLNTYNILADKIEQGINYGFNRAHKHTNNPSEELLKGEIYESVMNSLSEIIDYK
jgi:hypothetical protein